MKHFVGLVCLAVVAGVGPVGCQSVAEKGLPQYEVDLQRYEPSPPAPVSYQDVRASNVVPERMNIEATTAVGYENLPATVTQLFSRTPVELAIKDVVLETLANNRELKIQGYTLRIAEYEVPVSKGIYDLVLGGRAQYERIEEQNALIGFSPLPVSSSRVRAGEVSLMQLLPTGATVNLLYNVVRSAALVQDFGPTFIPTSRTDVRYRHVTALGITQPLLEGFGSAVTNAGIRIAQQEQAGAAADFQSTVEDQITSALVTYWNLIGAVEIYTVRVISYAAARDLVRINRAKLDVGVVPRTEVLQAEAAVADRERLVIEARRAVRELEDQLKRLLFLREDTPLWEAEILPTQPVTWREIDVDTEEAITVALDQRAELRRADSNLQQARIGRTVARNALLPRLDMFGQVETNGLGEGFDEGFRNHDSGDYVGYVAGLDFSYPLQNRADRYRFKQAEARVDLNVENVLLVQDRIIFEVRRAVRDLNTARERIRATQVAVRSEQANLDAENLRLQEGLSTAFEVLQFQEDLANAQSEFIQAVVDYNQAAVRLERARGTLLATYGIAVENANLEPASQPVLFPVGWD